MLRIIKNMLISGIVKPSDFEDLNLIEAIKPLMTSRNRITVIARIIGLLGESAHFQAQFAANKDVLESVVVQITKNSLVISDECLENCMAAIATLCSNNKDNSVFISSYPSALDSIAHFLRHPERNIKIQVAKILTSVNKFCKLPDEYQQVFKWIMMQMIQLMPDSIMVAHQDSITVIIEICGIIQSIA